MPKRPTQPSDDGILAPNDPRRPLFVKRLADAREQINAFAARSPSLDDPEFEQWEGAVVTLLMKLFDPATYLIRFRKLRIRPISHSVYGSDWHSEPREAWKSGLSSAGKILDEALEEASIEFPIETQPKPPSSRASVPSIVINNVFSPHVHVTMTQMLMELERLPGLTDVERDEAKEQIKAIEAETKGAQRWTIIGRHLDALKSFGKGVYENIAAPLIVEYLKSQMSPPGSKT